MSAKSTLLRFICKLCEKEFFIQPSRARDRGTVLHCSWQCRYGRDVPYLIGRKPIKSNRTSVRLHRASRKMTPEEKATLAEIRASHYKQRMIDSLVLGTRKSVSGCLLWGGRLTEHGYGIVTGNYLAHRVSFESFVSPIPDGLKVLHKCDVRNCINPDHLFIGTLADNVYDMVSKGRNVKGSRSNFAKLKEEQVIELRRIAATGMDRKEIAKMFNIDLSTVYCIVRRSRWKTL